MFVFFSLKQDCVSVATHGRQMFSRARARKNVGSHLERVEIMKSICAESIGFKSCHQIVSITSYFRYYNAEKKICFQIPRKTKDNWNGISNERIYHRRLNKRPFPQPKFTLTPSRHMQNTSINYRKPSRKIHLAHPDDKRQG